ncbi:hypothetical protein DRO97_09420 [Archaeoglobales archaeon]|nr:MAG: hypothetical protein DRO97_09420 [Archaeoglobales archaeon]
MEKEDWRVKELRLVILHWRDRIYVGYIKEIAPEFSKEIVLLYKSFNPVEERLIDVVRDLNNEELYADDSLDLFGRYHLARKLENRLTVLTPEQELYMGKRMLRVYEMIMDDKVLGEIDRDE